MKDIKIYRQRKDSCAIACLMMTLEYFGIMKKANWYDERRLYRIYKSKYISGTPFAALAYHLSKNGLVTTIYHSNIDLFSNDKTQMSKETFNLLMEEYKELLQMATNSGTKIINGIDINAKLIKEKIQRGEIIILAGKINDTYHAILVTDYENDSFIVCDPLYKDKKIKKKEELDEFMDTSIGKWFIAISDKKKGDKK